MATQGGDLTSPEILAGAWIGRFEVDVVEATSFGSPPIEIADESTNPSDSVNGNRRAAFEALPGGLRRVCAAEGRCVLLN